MITIYILTVPVVIGARDLVRLQRIRLSVCVLNAHTDTSLRKSENVRFYTNVCYLCYISCVYDYKYRLRPYIIVTMRLKRGVLPQERHLRVGSRSASTTAATVSTENNFLVLLFDGIILLWFPT